MCLNANDKSSTPRKKAKIEFPKLPAIASEKLIIPLKGTSATKVNEVTAIDTVSKIQLSIEKNSKTAAKVIS